MLKFTENFSMTFAENRTYGVPEFAETEVNRHSSKLKGLSGGQGKKGLHHNMENTLACEEVKQYMHLQVVSYGQQQLTDRCTKYNNSNCNLQTKTTPKKGDLQLMSY